jgi:hypothetical protein
VNSQRSLFGFLVAGAIALIVIVIAGFYWFFPKSPVSLIAPTSQPGAAIFVSKLAPVMVSLLDNPDRLQALERQGEVSQLKTSLLANSAINYEQDIKPWLGNEITLAVTSLDLDRDPENGQQPGYLMVLATRQPEKSREFLELLFSKRVLAGGNLATEEYNGVKLLYDNQPPLQDLLAGAFVGNGFVLFANDPKVLREAINNVQAPDVNLSSSSEYQKTIQQLPKGALATAFLNLPIVAKWQGLELREPTYTSQIISLVLNPQGLLAETSLLSVTEIVPPSAPLAQPVGALQYIPESAGLVIAGANLSNLGDSDLAKFTRQATTTLYGAGEDITSKLVKPLADLQKRWGLNLSQDIFSWVEREYAIALLAQKEQTIANWVFVVEKSPGLSEGIAHLDAIASANGLNTSSLSLDQQKIFAWTELTPATQQTDTKDKPSFSIEAKVQAVHTTLGNYEIFASNLETINEILIAKEDSLIENPNFQNNIAVIPQPNQGYIYLDWTKTQKLLERQQPILKLVEIVGKPLFHNLRSLTVSSYGSDSGFLKGGIFFQIQP